LFKSRLANKGRFFNPSIPIVQIVGLVNYLFEVDLVLDWILGGSVFLVFLKRRLLNGLDRLGSLLFLDLSFWGVIGTLLTIMGA